MVRCSWSSSGRTHALALPMVRRLTSNSSATISQVQILRRPRMTARTRSASVIFSQKMPPRALLCRSAPRLRWLRRWAWAACCVASRSISVASAGAHPGQHRVAQGREPIGPARDGVGCQEVPQRCRAGETQDGGLDTVPALGQDLAGLGDRLGDRSGADLQHLGQHELRADLPQVDNRDQGPVGAGEHGPAVLALGLAAGSAASFEVALLEAGVLQRGQLGGQLIQLPAAHTGQPGIGQVVQGRGAGALPLAGSGGRLPVLSGGVDGVVPGSPLDVGRDRQRLEAFGADRHAQRVGAGVQGGVHAQSGAGTGGGDQVDDHLVAGQGPPAPVHRDVGEQSVLYLVPLAGSRTMPLLVGCELS